MSPILGRRRDRYQADSAGTSISTGTVIATHTPIWGITIAAPYSFAMYPSEQRDTASKLANILQTRLDLPRGADKVWGPSKDADWHVTCV